MNEKKLNNQPYMLSLSQNKVKCLRNGSIQFIAIATVPKLMYIAG